jgi:hypothetical protein
MFRLDLSDQEHEMLKELLRERLGTLREEIHHSETFYYRDELKKEKMVLYQLSVRVESSSGRLCGRNTGQYYAGPVECVSNVNFIP